MSREYLILLVTHGDLAFSLKGAMSKLTALSVPLYCFSNQEKSLQTIENEIEEIIRETGAKRVILFVDLLGGSCWMSARRIKRAHTERAVLGGVNLPMLLSFFLNYEKLAWEDLLDKIIEDGKKGIVRA